MRGLLTEEDVQAVYRFARDVGEQFDKGNNTFVDPRASESESEREGGDSDDDEGDGPEPGSAEWLAEQMRLTAQLSATNFDAPAEDDIDGVDDVPPCDPPAGWVRMSASHRKLWLHRGGPGADGVWTRFGDACPGILVKLLEAMHASTLQDSVWRRPDSHLSHRPEVHVRCIEFHSYSPGGGLQDPGHVDVGSTLTLSVQLSPPGPPDHGGRFTTTGADGSVSVHELSRGDAVIFCSESVHNVTTLRKGERNSLVVELWTDPANRVDRHH